MVLHPPCWTGSSPQIIPSFPTLGGNQTAKVNQTQVLEEFQARVNSHKEPYLRCARWRSDLSYKAQRTDGLAVYESESLVSERAQIPHGLNDFPWKTILHPRSVLRFAVTPGGGMKLAQNEIGR